MHPFVQMDGQTDGQTEFSMQRGKNIILTTLCRAMAILLQLNSNALYGTVLTNLFCLSADTVYQSQLLTRIISF